MAGGSDSENSYLVEGQETANLIGGYSHTNVPFDFIQEVQIKSSGIEAEHGGALGGVVNVVMKKGSNAYHGSFSRNSKTTPWMAHRLPAPATIRLERNQQRGASLIPATRTISRQAEDQRCFPRVHFRRTDVEGQGVRSSSASIQSGRTRSVHVNYGPTNGGVTPFSQNTQTYYTTARIDASCHQKIRVFGSWLYQYQRQTGRSPAVSTIHHRVFFNPITGCFGLSSSHLTPPYQCLRTAGIPAYGLLSHLGYSAPNSTTNVGADFTITPHIVATTRFGYYFENYHDFGFRPPAQSYNWAVGSIGGTDTNGTPLPAALQQSNNYFNSPFNQNYTLRNANKAIQFDADLAWFKSGWKGTHNFKFGYQLNRLSNDLASTGTARLPNFSLGTAEQGTEPLSSPATPPAQQIALPFVAKHGSTCQGKYGYADVYDFGPWESHQLQPWPVCPGCLDHWPWRHH